MGRPRKPTALKILDGDQPCRIGDGPEPTAPAGLGDCPAWLDRHGRDAWARLEAAHRTGSLLTRLDAEAAALYCQAYSTYRHALATICDDLAAAEPDGPSPWHEPHPMHRIAIESHRQMMRVLSKFGMTPSDRAGLHVTDPAASDELLSFLAAPPATHGNRKRKATGKPMGPESER